MPTIHNRRFLASRSPRAIACIVVMASLAIISAILLICLAVSAASYPLHASCKVKWDFGVGCSEVRHSLIAQVGKWTGAENCQSGGQKCLYEMKKQTEYEIKATHTTPKKKYIDDLLFNFHPTLNMTGCIVDAFSTSQTWYALLDFGTNYCNLHNLITGAKLDTLTGYKETTRDAICTQYSSANCEVY